MGMFGAIVRKAQAIATWSTRDPAPYLDHGYLRMYELLGGGQGTSAGIAVNVKLAMTCSAVNICTRVITESLASLPLGLYSKQGMSTIAEQKAPLSDVLSKRPNQYKTSKRFRQTFFHHAINYGAGYARIIRRGNDPEGETIGLIGLHPSQVEMQIEDSGEPLFLVRNSQGKQEKVKDAFMLHLLNFSDDGDTGVGAIEMGREDIALGLAIQRYGSAFFARGGVPAGMIVKEVPFRSQEDRDRFKGDWAKEYEGFQGFFKKMLVEGGSWKFERFGISPSESQMIEAQAAILVSIARYYNLTPHMAGDLSRAHFSNVEELGIQFLKITLTPWLVGFEQEIWRSLLTPRQRESGWYAKHNINAFQRGDFLSRMSGYATMLQNGVISLNDARALEDMDPVASGGEHLVQLNMQNVKDVRANSAAKASKNTSASVPAGGTK